LALKAVCADHSSLTGWRQQKFLITITLAARKSHNPPKEGIPMKSTTLLVLAASVVAFSASASAQFAKPEDAVKYRKSALFVMQQNFSRVAAMAAGKAPFDAKVAAESAAVADFVAKLPWAAFGEGTDKGDTRAKPEIWKEPAKFKEYADKMQLEMSKLSAAAKTGSLDSIKTAVSATGGTCKTCHDAFRKE
jgi:cytochrome c556